MVWKIRPLLITIMKDIRDVMTITSSKMIEIRYYEADLNDDGMNDLIVSLISPLHS